MIYYICCTQLLGSTLKLKYRLCAKLKLKLINYEYGPWEYLVIKFLFLSLSIVPVYDDSKKSQIREREELP